MEDRNIRVCRAEDLLLHKIVSERGRDQEDVVGVPRRHGRRLELEELDGAVATVADELGESQFRERWDAAKVAAGL